MKPIEKLLYAYYDQASAYKNAVSLDRKQVEALLNFSQSLEEPGRFLFFAKFGMGLSDEDLEKDFGLVNPDDEIKKIILLFEKALGFEAYQTIDDESLKELALEMEKAYVNEAFGTNERSAQQAGRPQASFPGQNKSFLRKTLLIAACLLVFFLLPRMPEIMASFQSKLVSWQKERSPSHTQIMVTTETDQAGSKPSDYKITWLPDGYHLVSEEVEDEALSYRYAHPDTPDLWLSVNIASDGVKTYLGTSNSQIQSMDYNHQTAYHYTLDPYTYLVYERDGLLFVIISPLGLDSCLALADGIQAK